MADSEHDRDIPRILKPVVGPIGGPAAADPEHNSELERNKVALQAGIPTTVNSNLLNLHTDITDLIDSYDDEELHPADSYLMIPGVNDKPRNFFK